MHKRAFLVALLFLAACAPSVPQLAEPVAALDGEVVASGTFTGESNHVTTGAVRVVRLADGSHAVELGSDFFHDGAPDPVVGFGADGYVAASKLGPLAALTGRQIYPVPAGLDVTDFNQVYIWCERFSVPLGSASLLSS